MTVELAGLEIFGYHGLEQQEQRDGQPFLYDLWLEVSDAALSDRIEDAIDYRDIAACVREVSDSRQFRLLEALCTAVAETILQRFEVERVRVRVRKPQVRPAGLALDYAAATVELPR